MYSNVKWRLGIDVFHGCLLKLETRFLSYNNNRLILVTNDLLLSNTKILKFKFIYSHLFSYNIMTIKNKKEVKENRADYTLS